MDETPIERATLQTPIEPAGEHVGTECEETVSLRRSKTIDVKEKDTTKMKVMSIRFDQETYRRLQAYATSTGQPESTAARTLIVRGLAADGLDLYSNEVAGFVRDVMSGVLAEMDAILAKRNDEHEDRIARVVARSAKQAAVASLACVDIVRGLFPSMRERTAEEIWRRYSRRAGEMQAGHSFQEALRDASKS